MNNCIYVKVVLFSMFFSGVSYADVTIKSPVGGSLIFSQEKKGESYDSNSWGKINFSISNHSIDLSRSERYYIEDGSSKVSPSGKYLIINSVSGGNVDFGDGNSKYSDRAYCSIIDMTSGCIVSDWNGEACGYTWVGNKDVLANSEDAGADIFDFKSMQPSINKMKNSLSSLDVRRASNILRCDTPSKENINNYQKLVKENKNTKVIITNAISEYLRGILREFPINSKESLFTLPDNSGQTNAYLVPGDKIKIIQNSPDNKWVNIGYIDAKGNPLVAWVKADALVK